MEEFSDYIVRLLPSAYDDYAVSQSNYIQKHYGPNARTVVYKKMTIVYRLAGSIVLVQRVMASNLIR